MLKLYLDTSAILKRYLTEPGTEAADLIYEKAEAGELTIVFSLWNLGEVLGVLDEKLRRGWLTKDQYDETLAHFANELLKLIRLKTLEIVPIQTPMLLDTWKLLLTHHIYEADALQIASSQYSQADALLTGDEKLVQASAHAGIETINLTKNQNELEARLKQTHKAKKRD
ncbi:MAG: type II toxin-antitoxin system VapC family toxin [Candidatus Bathyarchaeota archaeon]|nr:type II toxin-antitoxin system VapC family toxin [Candidatus Bathyarchaeota archaeon]